MDAYLGTIMLWPINWAPDGWLFCNGQMLQVGQYQALYSLMGNVYGGDGSSTFALPNLTGRVPVGISPDFPFAKVGGKAANTVASTGLATGSFTLSANQLPTHNHLLPVQSAQVSIPVATSSNGNTNTPGNTAVFAKGVAVNGLANYPTNIYSTTAAANDTLEPFLAPVTGGNTSNAGGGAGVPLSIPLTAQGSAVTIQPWTAINFIICVSGIYPPRP